MAYVQFVAAQLDMQLHVCFALLQRSANDVPIVDPPERVAGFFKLNRTHDAHMFYFFYESRSKGPNDPVILWMTGTLDASATMQHSCFMHISLQLQWMLDECCSARSPSALMLAYRHH